MGRELKRVPVDFDHPIDTIWPGFQRECSNEDCDGCTACESQEPPTGDAYQVWENVSEGSPISPAFASREACAAWLIENEKCSPAAAEKFIDDGYAPSFMGGGFGLFKGVQVAAGVAAHIEWLHVQAGDYTTVPSETPIRHLASGVTGKVNNRFPPGERGEYYYVTWDRALPSLLDDNPDADPGAPMDAGCRSDGFEVVQTVGAAAR